MRPSLRLWWTASVIRTLLACPANGEGGIEQGAPVQACNELEERFPGTVLWPESLDYHRENEQYWSPTTYSEPACVFVPETTKQVAAAVETFVDAQSPFAVRGGGHMPIPGYSNTDDGVLIALSKLNNIQLSEDKSYVSVGPGRTWGEVYNYLEPHGLVALGGRVGIVGVPGLILGGGISFYSSQYGFASDNVVAFEVVLAKGEIVTATAEDNSDLFWALKGGGNSFGIVTRFDLETFSSPKVCAGILQIPSTERDAFLNAVANFGQHGSADTKAAVIPSIFMLASLKTTVYTSALFYDDDGDCEQPVFQNFTAIPTLDSSYGQTTLATYIAGTDAMIPPGVRQKFQVVSTFATLEAIEIVHDTFVTMVNEEIGDVADLQASVAFQPVTKDFIQKGVDKGGNPQGVDPDKAPYFWMVENFSWSDPADDERINAFTDKVTCAMNERLAAAGQKAHYQYLNDAGHEQEVFKTYPAENLKRLKQICHKYDPHHVFTDLLSGGWKVLHA